MKNKCDVKSKPAYCRNCGHSFLTTPANEHKAKWCPQCRPKMMYQVKRNWLLSHTTRCIICKKPTTSQYAKYCSSCWHSGQVTLLNRRIDPKHKSKASGGYIFIAVCPSQFISMADKRGRILEHRLIVAQSLDRPLLSIEMVHHLNGIRDDNRLSNLVCVNSQNHPNKTLMKLLRKRIKELEVQLSQRFFPP